MRSASRCSAPARFRWFRRCSLERIRAVWRPIRPGAWLFPLGYLVYKATFPPRFLGLPLLLDGVVILFWFLQVTLLPDYPALSYPAWP
jgi:hypothetical protein